MINLIIAAEEWLGIEIEPDTVYEYRSVNALSEHLATLIDRQSTDGRQSPV
jgi:acyl carrier protein